MISKNFTVYLLAFGYMDIIGAEIQGPRIGLCAHDIAITASVVNSAERGCPSDNGLGHGNLTNSCAGSGGAHGGRGGYGGIDS